jgi:formate dehydrogenase beta subunit
MAGGMMHFGIPSYRLPRDVLDAEIKRIENMGVKIVLNHRVDDLMAEKEAGKFDALFIAVGAHISKRTEIPSRDAGKMLDAISFLKDVETGNAPKLGRKVAIYGGGNTAMDAARVAKRLGYEPLIIYRRDRAHMPAHDFEATEALEEDVKIHWLRTIKNIEETKFTVEIMEVDAKGRPQPTGQFETLEADALIMALGQDVDTSFMRKVPGVEFKDDGVVTVDENMMTGYPGLFAGGDMVPSDRTVTIGVGHGKKAARNIDAWLRGDAYLKPPKHAGDLRQAACLVLHRRRPASAGPSGDERRVSSFEEVVAGLSQKEALYEAKRCLSCGNCYECDGCYGACPEDAIIKLGPGKRYRYDYDLCTGCAVCFEQCPCHAIEMIPEPPAEASEQAVTNGAGESQSPPACGGPREREAQNDRTASHHHRRQRGCGLRRLSRQRSLHHLSHHPVLDHGRAGGSMGVGRRQEHLGQRPLGHGNAERGGRSGRGARRVADRRADHHLHRVAGAHADDPQHVQDRRRTDLGGVPCRRPLAGDAGFVDLRRSSGRDGGAPDRLLPAGLGIGAGSPRYGADRPGRDPGSAGAVHPFLRWLPHLARGQQADPADR